MPDSLKSKKFWAMILGTIASAVLPQFGVPPQAVDAIKTLVLTYLGVEGGLDALSMARSPRKEDA